MSRNILISAAIGCVLAGCGGAGVGGAQPDNTVRRNLNGDSFSYLVGGTYTQSGVVTNASTSGTATDLYTSDTYNATPALQRVFATTITLQLGPTTSTETQQYDATSWATLAQSDAGTLEAVTSGAFTPPGTLLSSTALNTTEVLANGTQVSILYRVTGSESVLTPKGSFTCWIIHRQAVYSDGLTQVQTIDFAPDLGAAVRIIASDSYTSGYSDSLTLTLSDYTLGVTP